MQLDKGVQILADVNVQLVGFRSRIDLCLKRGDPAPRCVGGVERRLMPELLDEIRELIEKEHVRISVNNVSNRFTLSRT